MLSNYIGDKSQFYNAGLEEPDMAIFTCTKCLHQDRIASEWDGYQMKALDSKDLICPACCGTMER